MELFKASNQWATRPNDERFWTLSEMAQACKSYADTAAFAHVPHNEIRTEAVDGEVQVTGKVGTFARMTHWAFGQLSTLIGAPANYLRSLPPTLAVQNLNHGLKKVESPNQAELMFHKNGNLLLRCVTSNKYTRIWDHEIASRLMDIESKGWKVPPARPVDTSDTTTRTRPATEQDVLRSATAGWGVKVGDLIAPAGLYASDHDMFAFMVNEDHPIDSGSGAPMYRGFFAWNSEVGASSFGIMTFFYDSICQNHIVWGAKNVNELRVRHIGNADSKAFGKIAVELRRYSDSSVSDIEATIKSARKIEIAGTKDEVLDRLFEKRISSRKNLELAYVLADEHQKVNGNPNTVWGMVSGLTRLSQETSYSDERVALDRQAGKLLEIAF